MHRSIQYILLLVMLLAAFLAYCLAPSHIHVKRLTINTLAQGIPMSIGSWSTVPTKQIAIDLYQTTTGERTTDNPYDDTLIRTYQHVDGSQIQLAIAYGALQQQEIKIHRPELCYYAQGYEVYAHKDATFKTIRPNINDVKGKVMLAKNGNNLQLVSYWIRIGRLFSQNAWQTRLYLIKEGLLGRVPDGVLVRVSTKLNSVKNKSELMQQQADFLLKLQQEIDHQPTIGLLLGN